MLECDVCDRNPQANKNNLREHMEAHYRRGEGTYNGVEIECKICEKTFYDPHGNYKHVENMRKQHMKVHEPRSIPCPIAQDKFFKNPADAVKHVESGTCENCRGKERARMAIFDFLKSKKRYLRASPWVHRQSPDLDHPPAQWNYVQTNHRSSIKDLIQLKRSWSQGTQLNKPLHG